MDKKTFDEGLEIRRAVLGPEYVDASLKNADEFSRPLQELVTQYVWGEIWSRPELDRRTRSIVNLGVLASMSRPHELKLHVRGALRNGVSRTEIREIFLQVAVYCGMPAAIEAFRAAREVFAEVDQAK
jgi:4-carboxymuconolactone decarboxylase